MRTKKYYLTYLLWYSAAFVLVTAAVLSVFLVQGRSLVCSSDALAQYFPSAVYFRDQMHRVLASVLKGDFSIPLYDFAIGLGNVVPFHFEPLYWLFLLFDESQMETAYGLTVLVRFYCAGLSMSAFLLYFRNGRAAALLGSFAYIYADFGMRAAMYHLQFLVPMIMLPLCVISVEEILRKKRWYLCTIVIWIHLWCGYYFTYMDTIAMGIYFLIRFFCRREGRTCREFFLRLRTLVLSYLLGILIGNITLVNSFASYLNSSRMKAQEYESLSSLLTYGWSWPARIFNYFLTAGRVPGNWMRLGFIPLVYIGLVVLFLRRGKRELKAAVITVFVFAMIPAVGFVFSGFNNINNRWCYMLAFAVVAALAFTVKDMLTLTGKERVILGAACLPCLLPYVYCVLADSGKHRYISWFTGVEMINRRTALITAAVLALSLAAVWLLSRFRPSPRKAAAVLLGVALFSHWCYGLEEYLPAMGNVAAEFAEAGTVADTITKMPLAAAGEIEDDGFYRVATNRVDTVVQNASQMLGYYGTTYFSSTISRYIQEFFAQNASATWNLIRLRGFDGRAFLNALASVKYYALRAGKQGLLPYGYEKYKDVEKNGVPYEVFENRLALPLGYTYDRGISEQELLQYDYPQRQEVMLQAAVLPDASGSALSGGSQQPVLTGKTVELRDAVCRNLTFEDHRIAADGGKKGKSSLKLTFDAVSNAEIYLYIRGMRTENDERISFTYTCGDYEGTYGQGESDGIYTTGQDAHIINLGYHSEPVESCRIVLPRGAEIAYDELQIYCQPMDNMESYIADLRENVLENVELPANRVNGTIHLDEDKLLVLSIPYDRGWTACVDGEERELLRANIMYMGLPLDAGDHVIELRYRLPGIGVSLALSAAGLLILAAALVIRARRRALICEKH